MERFFFLSAPVYYLCGLFQCSTFLFLYKQYLVYYIEWFFLLIVSAEGFLYVISFSIILFFIFSINTLFTTRWNTFLLLSAHKAFLRGKTRRP